MGVGGGTGVGTEVPETVAVGTAGPGTVGVETGVLETAVAVGEGKGVGVAVAGMTVRIGAGVSIEGSMVGRGVRVEVGAGDQHAANIMAIAKQPRAKRVTFRVRRISTTLSPLTPPISTQTGQSLGRSELGHPDDQSR